jgi:predicted Zn-dependent peptidase
MKTPLPKHVQITPGFETLTVTPITPSKVSVLLTIRHAPDPTLSAVDYEMIADTFLSGTERHSQEKIEELIKKHGLIISAINTPEYMTFTLTCLDSEVKAGLALFTELILEPRATAREVTHKKATYAETLRTLSDDERFHVNQLFMSALVPPSSPLYVPTLADEARALSVVTPRRITRAWETLYAGQWYLSATASQAVELGLKRLLRAGKSSARPVASDQTVYRAAAATRAGVPVPGKSNVEVRIGHPLAVTLRDPAERALTLGVNIFAKPGGFIGRLMSTVREQEGLTYGIYALIRNETTDRPGLFVINTFFSGPNLERGIASTHRELKTLVEKGVTAREVSVMKEIMANELILSSATNMDQLGRFHFALLGGLAPQAVLERDEAIQALTHDVVSDTLRAHLLPDHLTIAVAGPVTPAGQATDPIT